MDSQTISELKACLPFLTESERAALDLYLRLKDSPWAPLAGPQLDAYLSDADILFYGGAAGGGKTDLLLGLAETAHTRTIIFRREYPQLQGIIDRMEEIRGDRQGFNSTTGIWRLGGGRVLELGAVQLERDVKKYQGRPHDLKGFDEITHFTEDQFRFLIGWNRTARLSQRTRVVCTGNPPTDPEGEWVLRFWAPWLDPEHPNPAQPGELRYFAVLDGEDVEVGGPEPFEHDGELITPKSRTFIPARVEDNPFLMAAGYKATLQNLPEPLRTAMLKGIFGIKGEDNRWQVIPTLWVDLAMERWKQAEANGYKPGAMDAIGADVARGGKDKTVLAPRHGRWFAPLVKVPGVETPDGPTVAALVETNYEGQAVVNLDLIGVGGSAYDCLNGKIPVVAMVGSARSESTDRSGRLGFVNKRAEWYWLMREALDPEHGLDLMLPPDRELRADLCASRWKLTPRGIQIEAKEDVIKRIGRSPDCGDAVIYALPIETDGQNDTVVEYYEPIDISPY